MQLGPGTRTNRTRSDLERDFLHLCRRFGLPTPEVNVKVGHWTVDFLWRDGGSRSRPTTTTITEAESPFRTIVRVTSTCGDWASTFTASANSR